jgi:hypothetical protein
VRGTERHACRTPPLRRRPFRARAEGKEDFCDGRLFLDLSWCALSGIRLAQNSMVMKHGATALSNPRRMSVRFRHMNRAPCAGSSPQHKWPHTVHPVADPPDGPNTLLTQGKVPAPLAGVRREGGGAGDPLHYAMLRAVGPCGALRGLKSSTWRAGPIPGVVFVRRPRLIATTTPCSAHYTPPACLLRFPLPLPLHSQPVRPVPNIFVALPPRRIHA